MGKSLRCKKEKRLRAIRRDMVHPFYDKRDAAKMAALEAALAAPKMPNKDGSMEIVSTTDATPSSNTDGGDIEMADNTQKSGSLKPIGRKMKKKKLRMARTNPGGKRKVWKNI